MSNTFSIVDNMCREDSYTVRPKADDFVRIDGAGVKFYESKAFVKAMTHYNEHKASLRSSPILPGSVWEKTTGLVEGKDFEFKLVFAGNVIAAPEYVGDKSRTLKTYKRFVVPLPAEGTRSQEELWADVFLRVADHKDGAAAAIAELKQHYHITRK